MSEQNAERSQRIETLKKLRTAHADSVERTKVLVKEQKLLQQAICQFIQDSPKTIPQIAVQVQKPAHEVLWYVAILKKYGIVAETGMCGDYPLYQRVKESEE